MSIFHRMKGGAVSRWPSAALAVVLLGTTAAAVAHDGFDYSLARHGQTVVWRSHNAACGTWKTYGLGSAGSITAQDTANCVDDYAVGEWEGFCVARITGNAPTATQDYPAHGDVHTKRLTGRTLSTAPESGTDLCRKPAPPADPPAPPADPPAPPSDPPAPPADPPRTDAETAESKPSSADQPNATATRRSAWRNTL